ncbi:LxmA leader domain family RiPP [Streptomyces flaveolus]|jgi:hypothetical protein|uniref:LxmA leader domain family RiPP n=1 Tax=Streptomyces flaveolus TaxID=67297 RepID=A0ABV1VC52_9ACTN|nr:MULTISPECIES: LxmA leader domain family RiPP [unclassified Streptomyces]MCG8967132.1 LxmA leader domain family RiPP [Streptomyces sp. CL12-4]MCG8967134.1 LxmA leader domain family RiPP [Streptomyces sp. CL12-4]
MDKSMAIMELVSHYDAYADVDELNITAAADAPATTPVCAASVASSSWCAASASAVSGATYELTC